MNEDYLWDKTGEPDPEIQQLEQVLGTLRYQPRPLEIPEPEQTDRRTFFFRGLAIAATIAMMLVGLGLWFGLQRRPTTETAGNRETTPKTSESTAVAIKEKDDRRANDTVAINRESESPGHRVNPRAFAGNTVRNRRATINSQQLAAKNLKEAAAAKDQLMLALRVASAKLNFAQKKTQSTNSENLIHNQHKIG